MKVAAAYIRVSTDDQLEYSPDSQLEKIKLYAEKNQILLLEEFIFVDEGISERKTKNRPAFNEMIGLVRRKSKPFDVILVWKFSRFARNREDSIVYKSMLRKEQNIDVTQVISLAKKWKTASFEEKRGVCSIIVNRIIIGVDGNVEIVWNV